MKRDLSGRINPKASKIISRPPVEISIITWAKKIKSGDPVALARAITLVESSLSSDQEKAGLLLNACSPHGNRSMRLGITGPPGVGKSSFIEYMGNALLAKEPVKIAVLAIDPSSPAQGGSILGDKTRMQNLAQQPGVFIRPSPSRPGGGGIHDQTLHSVQLCEYAGYDLIVVETVGIGQSELNIHDITDLTLLLIPPGGGDELQGIKRGVTEIADLILIHKHDSGLENLAKATQNQYQQAVHLQAGREIKVFTVSSLLQKGFSQVWEQVLKLATERKKSGEWKKNRASQRLLWFHSYLSRQWAAELNSYLAGKPLQAVEKKIRSTTGYVGSLAKSYYLGLKKKALKR